MTRAGLEARIRGAVRAWERQDAQVCPLIRYVDEEEAYDRLRSGEGTEADLVSVERSIERERRAQQNRGAA